MIEKIKKELEKITKKEERIKFLMDKIKSTKDKKLIIQIEEILNQIIQEESLEERIQIPQQQIDIPKRELEKRESLQEKLPQEEKKQDFFQKINYTRNVNYDAERERMIRDLSVNPTRRDAISNLNLSTAEIRNYFEPKPQNYSTTDETRAIKSTDFERFKSFEIPEMLKRRKPKTEDIKYEIT
nr:hypothetical protein [Nanoarchaeum sp.]